MSKRLYVGNCPYSATEQDLKDHFGQIGEVVSVDICMDRETQRPKGFVFIEMENADQAIEQLDGAPLMGRNLKVSLARPREQRGPASRRNYSDR